METKPHRLKIKYGDFEFELEGDREFVENRSNDIPSILSLLATTKPPKPIAQTYNQDTNSTRTPAGVVESAAAIQLESGESEGKPLSIGEFLVSKKFAYESDLVLGLGYFMEKYCSCNLWNTTDVKEYCKQGKYPIPGNVSKAVIDNVRKGFVMILPEKKDGQKVYQLTGSGETYVSNYIGQDKKPTKTKTKTVNLKKSEDAVAKVLTVSLESLCLEKYMDIHLLERAEERALLIIKIYSSEVGMEALTVDEIVAILKNKFGIPATDGQIRNALNRSKPKVDTIKLDGKTKYKLMKPGEDLLNVLQEKYIASSSDH